MKTDTSGMQLRDYVSVLRRRRWILLLVTLLVVGSALVASLLQTPVYQARARLLLEQSQSPFDVVPQWQPDFVETEIQIVTSAPVQTEVRKRIGSAPPISAIAVGTTSVVELRAESTSPQRAATIANTYAEAYTDFRRQQAIDNLLTAGREIQSKIDALQKEIDELAARLAEIPSCTGANPPPSCAEREALQRDRDAKISQISPFRQKLDQLQVDVSLKDGGSRLVSPATVPTEPIRPRPVRNGLLALGIGLVLGVALAFLFEHLDDSIKTKEDLERQVPDVDVLAIIPMVVGWKKGETLVVSRSEPSSPAAEAYRTLRTSLQFISVNRTVRTLQVTSPAASEGKSSTTANLAVAMARAGKQVIAVSCDLRRPRLHQFFGVSNTVGFTSVLLGEVSLGAAIQEAPNEPRLRVLASGPLPPNPSELLSSARAAELLSVLREHVDIVLIDCPPVLPVTDATVLADRVDATLLVVTAGSTTRKQVSRTVEILRQVNAPLIGAVLNGVSTEAAYGYAEYYYRYEPAPANGNGSRRGSKPRRRAKAGESHRG
ncbi:MAG: polysaccharide biosynthesis tyrosine autokinase [Actinomycetota bacterium]|nr:polysaccharide biosynthesis tyrosine autokinase [Actinomycetota bacterium]